MKLSKPKKSPAFKILSSRKFFILIVIFLIFVAYAFVKEMRRYQQTNDELLKVEKKLSSLQARHTELLELIDYFKSDSFVEIEARDKLGLRKEGEKVAVITDLDATSTLQSIWGSEFNKKTDFTPIYLKWWRYFFGNN